MNIYNAYSNIIAKKNEKKKRLFKKYTGKQFLLFFIQRNIHYIQVLDKVDHGH